MWNFPGLTDRRTKVAWWLLVAMWVAGVRALSSLPGTELPQSGIPYFDKIGHFVIFGVGAALFAAAWIRSSGRASARGFVLAVAILTLFGIGDEVAQQWTPNRTGADIGDMIANAIGGLTGCAVVFKLHARLQHRPSPPSLRGTAARDPQA